MCEGQVCNNVLTIGSTSQEIKKGHNKAGLVPNVLFYENAQVELSSSHFCSEVCKRCLPVILQHLHILEDMLKDFSLGEHLLLVGNQVCGIREVSAGTLYIFVCVRYLRT